MKDTQAFLDAHELGKLKWRCRRGMLENDLLIEKFFTRSGQAITRVQADALLRLMNLADNDLLDLLLARKEPSGDLDSQPVRQVLALLRG